MRLRVTGRVRVRVRIRVRVRLCAGGVRVMVGSSTCLVIRRCSFLRVRNWANKRFEMNGHRSFQIPVGTVPDSQEATTRNEKKESPDLLYF